MQVSIPLEVGSARGAVNRVRAWGDWGNTVVTFCVGERDFCPVNSWATFAMLTSAGDRFCPLEVLGQRDALVCTWSLLALPSSYVASKGTNWRVFYFSYPSTNTLVAYSGI